MDLGNIEKAVWDDSENKEMMMCSKILSREQFKEHFCSIDESEVDVQTQEWIYRDPSPDRDIRPSALFLELKKRLDLCWIRDSEATTRTYIDQVILDVIYNRGDILTDEKRKSKKYNSFGEVWSKKENQKATRAAEYMIGYGSSNKELQSMTFIVQAKKYEGDRVPWQLLATMAHFQEIRKDAQKKTYDIFGILTDSDKWEFFHLDQQCKIWKSKTYSFGIEKIHIWKFIDFIIDLSEKMSLI